jgi:hypothetical protein
MSPRLDLQGAHDCSLSQQQSMLGMIINHNVQAERKYEYHFVATKCRKRAEIETFPFLPPESHAILQLIRSIKSQFIGTATTTKTSPPLQQPLDVVPYHHWSSWSSRSILSESFRNTPIDSIHHKRDYRHRCHCCYITATTTTTGRNTVPPLVFMVVEVHMARVILRQALHAYTKYQKAG